MSLVIDRPLDKDTDSVSAKLIDDSGQPLGTAGNPLITSSSGGGGTVPDPIGIKGEDGDTIASKTNPVPISGAGREDVFGNLIIGTRHNSVEVHLDDSNWTSYVTTTLTSGGTVPQSGGTVIFTSGTNTNGRARAVSLDNVIYRPFHELYAAWTAAWLDGGLANSYQRIGLADQNFVNGLLTTFEGTSFGALYINNSVPQFVAQADWDDPCDGTAGSKYTLNGVPVAMTTATKQVFAAKAGLLGSLTLELWCYSPDQEPIKVHTFRRPNDSSSTIFSNFDMAILCDVLKTGAGSSSVRLSSACWAGGSTSDKVRITDPFTDRSLAAPVVALIRGKTTAGGGAYVDVKVNPSGALVADVSGSTGLELGATSLAALELVGVKGGDGAAIAGQTNQFPVKDDYNEVEYLDDQTSSGTVLTFTFSAAVQKIWVEIKATSADDSTIGRATTDGTDPTTTRGILLHVGQVQPIGCPSTTSLKVLVQTGYVVCAYGYRR